VADLRALVQLVSRGAESARAEARRVVDELVARGDLGREEAAAIEAAVADAVDANRRWLDERVLRPLREALASARAGARASEPAPAEGAGPPLPAALDARLAALEARLERIERKLDGAG
jgi:polyhydroxyalkanoate synthesis regulator phasin